MIIIFQDFHSWKFQVYLETVIVLVKVLSVVIYLLRFVMNKIFLYKFLNKGTFINERNMQYTKVFALN